MPFTNPIIAGTTLIREAIQSPDYVAGVSGWSINRDGSVEFNNAVVRGTLTTPGVSVTDTGLAIPATAAPAYPGFVFTTDIPALLQAKYSSAPEQFVAVALYYSDAGNVYWYEGISTTFRIKGWVHAGVAYESFREAYSGPTFGMVQWHGWQPGDKNVTVYGPSSGGYTSDHRVIFQKSLLTSDVDAELSWTGLADFVGPLSANGMNILIGQKGITSVTAPNGATTVTKSVLFPKAFEPGVVPHVTVNINNGSGTTSRWVERAYNVSNTGFTLFLFSGNAATTTGFTVDCTWSAVEQSYLP